MNYDEFLFWLRSPRNRRRLGWATIGIVGIVFVAILMLGYAYDWRWTGLVKYRTYSRKTLWDWMDLLIIPGVLALGGYLFTRLETRRTQEMAEQQSTLDREIADERSQDDVLQAYLDGMSQLLTDKERPLRRARPGENLSQVARARTLTALTRLRSPRQTTGIGPRSRRKLAVLQFLHESGLIAKDHPVLDLRGADLSDADLDNAKLDRVDLGGANLAGATLIGAQLRGANLSGAILVYTDLSYAVLANANLSHVGLGHVTLTDTLLDSADLSGSWDITNEELKQQTPYLWGAIMPNGQKYEDWLKSKGGGEDGENSGTS